MSGVNLYNREEDNFTRIRDLGSWIMDIDQDADGNIWFSSQEHVPLWNGNGTLEISTTFCFQGFFSRNISDVYFPVFQEKPVVQHFLDIYHLTVYIQLVDSQYPMSRQFTFGLEVSF